MTTKPTSMSDRVMGFLYLVILVMLFWVVMFIYRCSTYGWDAAGKLISVWPSDITVPEAKPHDCEFFTAPIGDKWCDYKGVVIHLGKDGKPKDDNAPNAEGDKFVVVWEKETK
jgi:hypothetical protein